mmetsp:Transcript_102977/g.272522  ORF Transcript_102977/g.272522 Transcript_102977/m.272522 type:complete len:473 (-) Transcript_102977:77-1495(-)
MFGGLDVKTAGLTVTAGDLTLTAGNFDAHNSPGTFQTSKGAITMFGDVTISGTKSLTQGTASGAGNTIFYGNLQVGDAGAAKTTTLHGLTDVTLGGLKVTAGGFTLIAGNFDASGSSGTFKTSTGSVDLKGDVAVDSTKTLTVGSAGAAGATKLYGTLQVGAPGGGNDKTTTLYGATTVVSGGLVVTAGDFTLTAGNFDASAGSGTFKTGTGAVTLSGNVLVEGTKTLTVGADGAAGKTTLYGEVDVGSSSKNQVTNLYGATNVQVGGLTVTAGGFTLAAGAFDASGSPDAFSTSTGAVTLSGNVAVSGTNTFTVGAVGNAGVTTLYGNVVIGDASTNVSYATTTMNGGVTVSKTGLTVKEGGFTLELGNFNASSSPGWFMTPTGEATMKGETTFEKVLTVGHVSGLTNGATNPTARLYGSVIMGTTAGTWTTSAYGDVVVESPAALKLGSSSAVAVVCDGTGASSVVCGAR